MDNIISREEYPQKDSEQCTSATYDRDLRQDQFIVVKKRKTMYGSSFCGGMV